MFGNDCHEADTWMDWEKPLFQIIMPGSKCNNCGTQDFPREATHCYNCGRRIWLLTTIQAARQEKPLQEPPADDKMMPDHPSYIFSDDDEGVYHDE